LWTGSLLLSALIVNRSRRMPIVINGALVAVVHIGWIWFWYSCLKATKVGGLSSTGSWFAGWQQKLSTHLRDSSFPVVLAVLVAVAAIVLLTRKRRHQSKFLCWVAIWMAAGSATLFTFLSLSFFPATRYFYGLIICAVLLGAGLLWQLLLRISTQLREPQPAVLACAVLAVMAVGIYPAYREARTPEQDWAAVMKRLAVDAKKEDLILAGPNSEMEIARVYAKAAGVAAPVPVILQDKQKQLHSAQTEDGLRLCLEVKKRVWFVTAYRNKLRTPQYWSLIDSQFTPVATVPGKNPIQILLHTP